MWITHWQKHSFTRTGIRTIRRRVRQESSVALRLDVPAQAPFGGHVLDVAEGQPYLPGAYPGGQRLVRSASADPGKDQGAAQDARISGPEFVVHEPPIVTDSHQ